MATARKTVHYVFVMVAARRGDNQGTTFSHPFQSFFTASRRSTAFRVECRAPTLVHVEPNDFVPERQEIRGMARANRPQA